MKNTNAFVANIFCYIIMINVIMIALEILGINQVLTPVQNMINEFLAFIPNLVAAALIAFIGYILTKFVSSLLQIGGGFLHKVVDRTGFKDTDKLVRILKNFVFLIIFIPFLIQALSALQLNSISEPANNLLSAFMGMIGQVLIAVVVLFIFIYGGKLLTVILTDLFKSMGLDQAATKIGVESMIGSGQSLSKLLANLLYFFLVFFGVITAVQILRLERLVVILQEILEVTGQIFLGLTLGAIAVAVALSYGLGGREAAGEHFKDIIKKFRKESATMSAPEDSKVSTHNPNKNTNPGTPGSSPLSTIDPDIV